MRSGGASRTSVFVCQGRAAADGLLAVGTFADPVAERLLHGDELLAVRAAREILAGSASGPAPGRVSGPQGLAAQSVRACAEIVVPRTVVIDDAVTDAIDGVPGGEDVQVVLVGAGLDTRPWRLSSLAGATVYSVDHPATQADTRDRSGELAPVAARLAWVPVDLAADPLGPALAAAGHDPGSPTVWVWEGVVPYLRREDVAATASAIARRSAAGSVLVVNYQVPSATAALGRRLADLAAKRLGAEALTADEPWRSAWTPRRMARLLGRCGFVVERDVDLLDVATRLGSAAGRTRSLRNGRVAVARRTA